jgi:hypothetical protein
LYELKRKLVHWDYGHWFDDKLTASHGDSTAADDAWTVGFYYCSELHFKIGYCLS